MSKVGKHISPSISFAISSYVWSILLVHGTGASGALTKGGSSVVLATTKTCMFQILQTSSHLKNCYHQKEILRQFG